MMTPGPLGGKVKDLFTLMETYSSYDESDKDKVKTVVKSVLYNMLKTESTRMDFMR